MTFFEFCWYFYEFFVVVADLKFEWLNVRIFLLFNWINGDQEDLLHIRQNFIEEIVLLSMTLVLSLRRLKWYSELKSSHLKTFPQIAYILPLIPNGPTPRSPSDHPSFLVPLPRALYELKQQLGPYHQPSLAPFFLENKAFEESKTDHNYYINQNRRHQALCVIINYLSHFSHQNDV